ncbi:hypothetical protein [Beijerinckia indica]|uniref:Uncharacterized protein n=1 Tax=Beijerinckia indica subsp. indica (strain ATCC 9039 / DSM 1715 / NCIMB 8712) TaxID=395963 RepID=B2IDA9_BEII9|nr:hypothetical protein [Beijerinckia indica]ACB93966.1 hypothetical protein Bind_0312 [Beijerinckia indica subsp. indica ATCC 9039]
MRQPNISHAKRVYIEREPSGNVLHIVTDLMHDSSSPGYAPRAHAEMMEAIAREMGYERLNYACYIVHSPDQK